MQVKVTQPTTGPGNAAGSGAAPKVGAGTGERGFTMVELMVSLTVMTIGVLGAIGVFNSSFAATGAANIRARAVALTTREVESVRAVPYDRLLVSAEVATRSEVIGKTSFRVTKAVTSTAAAGVPDALKRVTVSVSWTDHGGTHVVDQVTFVYPGGLGPRPGTATTPSTTAPSGLPSAPDPLLVAAPADAAAAASAVDVSWTATGTTNLSGFAVRYRTAGTTVTVTESLPAVARDLRVEGLSAGTTYTFEIAARSAEGALTPWVASAPITTAAAPAAGCVIGTPAVEPARVAKRPAEEGGALTVNPRFSVNTSGSCSGLRIVFQPNRRAAALSRPLEGGSGLRTRQLDEGGTSWDSGVHFVDLYDGSGTKRATVKLTVCEKSKSCK